jgi:serine/threonine-protein kinase RsbT
LGRVSTFCLATAVSELAHNLVRHATRGGTITVTVLRRSDKNGIEVIAEDDGPGIPDVTLAMQDGFSSTDGLGSGLPGAKRLMDDFEITSTVGTGTRIVARKWQ